MQIRIYTEQVYNKFPRMFECFGECGGLRHHMGQSEEGSGTSGIAGYGD